MNMTRNSETRPPDTKSIILTGVLSGASFVLMLKLLSTVSTEVLMMGLLAALLFLIAWRVRHQMRLWNALAKGSLAGLRTRFPRRLLPWICQNLIGHRKNVRAILEQIERHLLLSKRGRHLGAYLLMGPTGTGKTFFAHLISEGLFGPERILLIPMNQYADPNSDGSSIFQLILDQYRKTPEFLILLDEFDLAATHIQNSLLHFLDRGEIIEPKSAERYLLGYTVIIATTNRGVANLPVEDTCSIAPDGPELRESLVKAGLERPMVARFDGVYHFGELNKKEIVSISLIQMCLYYQEHNIQVEYIAPEVLLDIVRTNSSYREFGVRQLQRLVRNFSDPLVFEAKRRNVSSIVLEFDRSEKLIRIRDERRKYL